MKIMKIDIEDKDFCDYNFSSEEIFFKELERKILARFGKKALDEAVKISEETGLYKMTFDEINNEIDAARKIRKGSS